MDNNNNSHTNAKYGLKSEDESLYIDLYPERRGQKHQRNWFRTIFGFEGKEELDKVKCERNVYWCLRNSPIVKVLVAALNVSKCNFDFRRHISCEICHPKVSGGYDSELNQVVICQNVARKKSTVQGVLIHEMIHMFDYCQNELDFHDIHHLACSEIRAANLSHCSFLSAWIYGNASPINIREAHKECVKKKALSSVTALKDISETAALEVIDRVFPKCYVDLEPIGRRCRRNSEDMNMAFLEARLYGYEYKI